jgi:hypothetical protein
VEDTNRPTASVREVWEILPGENEHIYFREICQEDLDPSLFSPEITDQTGNFPIIPHPLLNPAEDCLDRVWTQTIIRINYQSSEWYDASDP